MTNPMAAAMLAGAGIDWAKQEIQSLMGLTEGAALLAFGFIILATWLKTKSLIPTIVAGLVGGLVLFAVANPDWFKTKVGGEFDGTQTGMPAVVREAPAPPTLAEVLAPYTTRAA